MQHSIEFQREVDLIGELIEEPHFSSLLIEINNLVLDAFFRGIPVGTIDSALVYSAIQLRGMGEDTLTNKEISELGQYLAYQSCLFAKHLLGVGQSFPKLDQIMATTEILVD